MAWEQILKEVVDLLVWVDCLIADYWAEMVFLVKVGLGAGSLDFRAATGTDAWLVVE